ncbi:hypothetical protein N658DRAFT_502303 [Parathielavia hyrcaniae]|uniref:Uncharacterized protein n=1 Tax=Parathielavia hyrcaniae TaxID=113614 RepID=A0AAN6SWP8_9PEZI|nr:hypothetical protein N658DRAFT_502303 [Parathielavia hyrcaniae]
MLIVEEKPRPHNRSTQARSRPSNEYTRCSQGSRSLAAPTSPEDGLAVRVASWR